jgi:hypothetical protein
LPRVVRDFKHNERYGDITSTEKFGSRGPG